MTFQPIPKKPKAGRYICGYSGHQPTHLPFFAVFDEGKWWEDNCLTLLRVIPDLYMPAPSVPYGDPA